MLKTTACVSASSVDRLVKTVPEWPLQKSFAPVFEVEPFEAEPYTGGKGAFKTKKPVGKPTGYNQNGGVEGICIYPLETIELILPVLVDEYLFCISSQDAFQGGVTGGKGARN